MFEYTGKSVELKYGSGYHFKVDYLPGNILRWQSLAERNDGAPSSGQESFYLNKQADKVYTLSWVEDTGFTVSQNLDFGQMKVYAFMSWNDGNARGGREAMEHRGSIKFVEKRFCLKARAWRGPFSVKNQIST